MEPVVVWLHPANKQEIRHDHSIDRIELPAQVDLENDCEAKQESAKHVANREPDHDATLAQIQMFVEGAPLFPDLWLV